MPVVPFKEAEPEHKNPTIKVGETFRLIADFGSHKEGEYFTIGRCRKSGHDSLIWLDTQTFSSGVVDLYREAKFVTVTLKEV